MTPKPFLDEINGLPIEERLQLVEDIWDAIAASPESVPVPDWHLTELDRRIDDPSPDPDLSWDEVRDRLRKRG